MNERVRGVGDFHKQRSEKSKLKHNFAEKAVVYLMCKHLFYVSEKHMPVRRDKMACMGIINTIFKIKSSWVFSTMLITFHLFISIMDTCA